VSVKASAPLFSVIVPTFERQHLIEGCLESIVVQSRVDTEVLVVDNASADKTVEAALNFGDRLNLQVLVNEKNHERSYSRNRGAREARGRFLVFLDSDDKLTPGALDRAANFARANPDCRFFFQLISRTVADLVDAMAEHWPGARWEVEQSGSVGHREATHLRLDCTMSHERLGWSGVLNFDEAVAETMAWYRSWKEYCPDLAAFSHTQIDGYCRTAASNGIGWLG
jgi:glycosyltransferase involved in cell wall biosynthesis